MSRPPRAARVASLSRTLAGHMLVVGALAWAQAAEARGRHAGAPPILVELFTAQGCTSCPEANKALADLSGRKGVLAITYSVDYWDYLGWPDSLAKPEFTSRQRAYDQRLKVREIYTPEIVVGGAAEAPGLEHDHIAALIGAAGKTGRRGPALRVLGHGARVKLGTAATDHVSDVWLIRYDPAVQSFRVKAGDNKGKTVTVANAVRELIRLGAWRGREHSFKLPPASDAGLKGLVVVQGVRGGSVSAVARL